MLFHQILMEQRLKMWNESQNMESFWAVFQGKRNTIANVSIQLLLANINA